MLNISLLRSALICSFALSICLATAEDEIVIYVSPHGSDQANGHSRASAVASLQRGVELGLAATKADKSTVKVRVGGGTYLAQRLRLPAYRAETYLILEADTGNSEPRFDGGGKGGTWLTVQAKERAAGHLSVKGFDIERYSTVIALEGARDDASLTIDDVSISDNTFRSIGQIAALDSKPSTAAVRLINAHNVRITNNRFVDIRNVDKCGLLHAIYIAHGSTDNVISGNSFEGGCGDAIRFRDRSGSNEIKGNRFVDAWAKAPITDWYCDGSSRDDCTKEFGECPSFGNRVADNVVLSEKRPPPPATLTYGTDSTLKCPLPQREGSRFVQQRRD